METRKKILEVIYSFEMGGSERLACAIAEAMVNHDYDVKVVALYTNSGPIKDQLAKTNIEAIGLDLEGTNKLIALWRILSLFIKERPDVVHAHHVAQLIKIYLPARLACVRRIILTEHASYSLVVKPRLRMLARIFAKRADQVTTVYKGLEEIFINDFHVRPDRVVTIPNGVDVARYKGKPVSAKADDKNFHIACLGRLVEAKDHENLVQAVKLVVESGVTDIRVNIIGDGPLRDQIESLIKKNKLSDYISMLGNRTDIEILLQSHDILVLSSKREGFPMVILEAMSCGVPCVATAVGGVPDIINSSNGWLVKKEDARALADGILMAYHNKNKFPEMSKAARETIIRHYDIRNILKMYESVF